MALTLKVIDHWIDGTKLHVVGTLTASGSYPSGGDPVPTSDPLIKSGSAPLFCVAQGMGGYRYVVQVGAYHSTAQPRALLRVFLDTTGLELAAGAYPAPLIAAPASFYGIFNKFV